MPEGPELRLASLFVNRVSDGKTYVGSVVKSAMSLKNPDIPWNSQSYIIRSESRGKEMKLSLIDNSDQKMNVSILFHFGMSGHFKFISKDDEIPKHAHLKFSTSSGQTLCFVDTRRFGRWAINAPWGHDRGPDPIDDYYNFRQNILTHFENDSAFNRPICETMLNQKFFNGIGNYLRAEILFRCGVKPFDKAKDVLSELPLKEEPDCKQSDLIKLCHLIPLEVLTLEGGKGYNVEKTGEGDYSAFNNWLKCYNNPEMSNLVDSNKRTVWFIGPPGSMVPANAKSRNSKKKKNTSNENGLVDHDYPDKKQPKKEPTKPKKNSISTIDPNFSPKKLRSKTK